MAEPSRFRPFKGLLLFAGIALVGSLLFAFVMSAVIPPMNVPDRGQLIVELDHMATHFEWGQGIPRLHTERCQSVIEDGHARTDALKTFREEFTRLDDQIAILVALGRVQTMVGECHFREALRPQNSQAQQDYLSRGAAQLALANQALEEANQRVVYVLKAKRNRVYNLERAKQYVLENDVQAELGVWQAYTKCLSQKSGKPQSVPGPSATSENPAIAISNHVLEMCRETSIRGS